MSEPDYDYDYDEDISLSYATDTLFTDLLPSETVFRLNTEICALEELNIGCWDGDE